MEMEVNKSLVTDFVLVGFTRDPLLRLVFFVLFLISYTLTLVGNVALLALIDLDSYLHTPMYFFVCSLFFLDVSYSSVYSPQILYDCLSKNNIMSLAGCAAQFFFSAGLAYSECFLLAAMAYDCYVAICNPLHYAIVMPKKLCIQLVIGSYVAGFVNAIIHTGNTFCLRFCGNNTINHFFCDEPPLVKMACEGIRIYEFIGASVIGCNVLATSVLILGIVAAIMRIGSAAGRRKAFSTCSAHLISVSVFYGSVLLMYSRPISQHSPDGDKAIALFYTIVNLLINPMIYSLRNKAQWGPTMSASKGRIQEFIKVYHTSSVLTFS